MIAFAFFTSLRVWKWRFSLIDSRRGGPFDRLRTGPRCGQHGAEMAGHHAFMVEAAGESAKGQMALGCLSDPPALKGVDLGGHPQILRVPLRGPLSTPPSE